MEDIFIRTQNLLGQKNMEKLKNSKVAIFGLGGVGSYTAEALSRCGIYNFSLFDNDIIESSNINRQLIALTSTVGRYKTQVMKERILDINPQASVETYNCFYSLQNAADYPFEEYSYIIDAIDTVTSKLILIENAKKANVPIISSMGTGNKLNPELLKIADIYETSVCPLAKVMRKELKTKGITALKTVYSTEQPQKPENTTGQRKVPPASISFVPSVAGLLIAAEVIKDILNR